ncbi:hypothetical protein BJ165DRAFT_1410958 [Panaeolus papilionaceus]|nr:hypothetical protein BJ165DRAFT_1410958 [Panaeolus papilionaceus]
MYPHSPTTRMHHSSSSSSYQYPGSSSTKHHVASPSLSLYTPTRTQTVREELAQCEGMDSVIQYDDVRGYFDRIGLPTSASMPERTRNPHNMGLSLRASTVAMPLPLAPIVGSPTPNAIALPILSPPAMKSLTPPTPMHHERQDSLLSHHHHRQSSSTSGYNGQQWHPQAPSAQPMPPGPDPLLTPKPMHHVKRSCSASSSHYCQSNSSLSYSRDRNGQPIASGPHNATHPMPLAPGPGPSRSVRYTQPKPGSSARSHRGGVYATQNRGEDSTAHARKRSTSGGIRIVTVYDVRGFEGMEPDPKFPNMMVVDRTGGEPMVVYRSGDVLMLCFIRGDIFG